jgi:hypothetical protein
MLSVRVCLVCVMRRRTEPRNAGSSGLIELSGHELRRDQLGAQGASAVDVLRFRFELSPGLASIRRRGPISTGLIVPKRLKGAYQLKGAYHVSLRHNFNRRHYRHGTC